MITTKNNKKMKTINERQKCIIERINSCDYVSVQELSKWLEVSVVTIRKDLTLLENKGYLFRMHGGAARQQKYAFELSVSEKENIYIDEKKSIAKAAKELIEDNDFITLASGSTVHYLAKEIDDRKKLTILTPAIRVALELSRLSNVNIIMLGGELRKNASSVVGTISESILKNFSCNKLFLGVDGIDLNFGISTSNASEAYLNQLMIKQNEKTIVLVDSSKVGKRAFGQICGLQYINTIVTDNRIDPRFVSKVQEMGIEVIVGKPVGIPAM